MIRFFLPAYRDASIIFIFCLLMAVTSWATNIGYDGWLKMWADAHGDGDDGQDPD